MIIIELGVRVFYLSEQFDGFSLPAVFTDRYSAADSAALKTAVYLLINGEAGIEELTEKLRLSPESAERSLKYWVTSGLITEGEVKKDRKMTYSQLARLSLENDELAFLLRESQRVAGEMLGHNDCVLIAELYQFEGISIELILTAISYSVGRVTRGRLITYARRVALDWKKAGIDTIEKAEKHIALMALRDKRCAAVAAAIDRDEASLNARDKKRIAEWFEVFGYDESFASEASLRSGSTDIAYLNGILKGWYGKGYKTVKATRAESSNAPVFNSKKGSKDSLLAEALKNYPEDDE